MIGIYQDDFIKFLKTNLGEDAVKTTNKNIICRCPWCEEREHKKHYHLHVSLEAPMFHCFKADCPQVKGTLSKLIRKITGKDESGLYLDKDFKAHAPEKIEYKWKPIFLPVLSEERYGAKVEYLKMRFRHQESDLSKIKGLVFNIKDFVGINKIEDKTLNDNLEYFDRNFVGFCTEHESILVLRNVLNEQHFRYYKSTLKKFETTDYYKIKGDNPTSKKIVLAEGIFDILVEHIFDSTENRDCLLYAAGLSTNYDTLLKSIILNEDIFKPEVHILADKGINLDFYKKKIKKDMGHVVDKLIIYFNRVGKDFADAPAQVEKFIL